MQANYWWGQMHYGPPNQTFVWALAPHGPCCSAPMHAALPRQIDQLVVTHRNVIYLSLMTGPLRCRVEMLLTAIFPEEAAHCLINFLYYVARIFRRLSYEK